MNVDILFQVCSMGVVKMWNKQKQENKKGYSASPKFPPVLELLILQNE